MERVPSRPTRVLIPLDGSLLGDGALRIGFALAERAGLPVTLLHVVERAAPTDAATDSQRHLTSALERFADVAPCDLVFETGRAADAIIDRAESEDVLVCMASRGRSGLARLAMGSVAEAVVRRNPLGTVVVGPHCAGFALARERAAALFCTDGSGRAASAAPLTARLARVLALSATVVQQVPPDEDVVVDGSAPERPLLDAAQANCASLQRYFEACETAATTNLLFGDTARSIVHAAAVTPATLIALASHGRTGIDRLALGSTAAAVVQRATCPVFVVGPAGATPLGSA